MNKSMFFSKTPSHRVAKSLRKLGVLVSWSLVVFTSCMEWDYGLEEEFNITVPEEDAVNIKTVGDIVKLIDEKN